MKIIHHASGSKGNAVQVDDVLIDAGIKIDSDFNLVVLTHSHIDHIKYLPNALERSKAFYTTTEVLESLETKVAKWSKSKANKLWELISEKLVKKPDYVETLKLVHDVPCVGYKIHNYVHITDTGVFDVPESIKNQKFYTIESNYDEVELDHSNRHQDLIDRIKLTHLNNEQAIDLAINLNAKEVMFVHLSDVTNSPYLAKISHSLKDNQIKKHYPLSFLEIEVK